MKHIKRILHATDFSPASEPALEEAIDLAKQKPGEINYGTYGIGSSGHLNMVLFEAMTGVKLQAVHYKGAAPATNDVVAGHIQMCFVSAGAAVPLWKGGKLKLIAVGKDNAEIAKELFISPKTASVHVTHILDKLGVSSRVEAALIAARLGLGTAAAPPPRAALAPRLTIARLQYDGGGDWYANPSSLPNLLRAIRDRGPVRAREIETPKVGWHDPYFAKPSLAKLTLEYLWRIGVLAVTARDGQEKVYDLLERVVPRHLQIIKEINRRFLDRVAELWPDNPERQDRLSIVVDGREAQVRMALFGSPDHFWGEIHANPYGRMDRSQQVPPGAPPAGGSAGLAGSLDRTGAAR